MGRSPKLAWALCAAIGLLVGACAPDGGATAGSRVGGETETWRGAEVVCPDGDVTYGIDVSYWQGTIDWPAVAADGVEFAFIRVSDGLDYYDTQFTANWAGAAAAGIARGPYQFFRSDEDPIAQANLLIDEIGDLGDGDLPPVIDVETTDGQSPSVIENKVGQWIDAVEAATGRQPIIYTGKYFWQDNVGSDAFAGYPLWIAHWGAECPNLPEQWTDWKFWQISASGAIAGISGDVDEDYFNGSLEDLLEYAADPPECGDGDCNGDETAETCPEDCADTDGGADADGDSDTDADSDSDTDGDADDCGGGCDCDDGDCGCAAVGVAPGASLLNLLLSLLPSPR